MAGHHVQRCAGSLMTLRGDTMSRQIMVGGVAVGGGAPVTHPVHVQYRHGGRGGHGAADPAPGGRRAARSSAWRCRTEEAARAVRADQALASTSRWWRISISTISWRCCAREGGIDKIRINPGNIGGQGAGAGRGGCLPRAGHPHPHRRQRRLTGKRCCWSNTAA